MVGRRACCGHGAGCNCGVGRIRDLYRKFRRAGHCAACWGPPREGQSTILATALLVTFEEKLAAQKRRRDLVLCEIAEGGKSLLSAEKRVVGRNSLLCIDAHNLLGWAAKATLHPRMSAARLDLR